jgi:hypothetical protein
MASKDGKITIHQFRAVLLIGAGLILFSHSVSGQLPATTQKAPLDTVARNKSAADAEADGIRKERRAQARSLLISLASDARSFRDQPLRARSLARIADALWDVDVEQGRTLFRNAWEAAEVADSTPSEYTLGQVRPNLRQEVLKLAVRRDRKLAEEFLEKLKADQQETKAENSRPDLWELPEAWEQRLSLAESLLRTGDIERALQFADPVLGRITISTLDFLTFLREKDRAAADQRYAVMLGNTSSNMMAEANTISLLSSYIFTPHTYVIFNSEGGASSYVAPSPLPPANVSTQLRLAFFQTAAGILLRPQTSPDQDQSTAGIAGKFMVVRRLMPLFEQYAPKEITEAMRAQFETLNSLVSDGVRERENDWAQKGIGPQKSLADQEQPLLDQIDHAKTSAERDELYFKLALLALSKDHPKARDYVSKIDESGFRKQAQSWVDWGLAISAIEKKKTETALELNRIGELTHIERVLIFTQAAKLVAKSDHDKALSLLEGATSEARRIDGADLDRPRALLGIANALKVIEPSRTWDATFDAVKAANSIEGFTGEDGVLRLTLSSKSQILNRMDAAPDLKIEGIFAKLASSDYDQAVQLARGFQGEAARANATIAIARAVLNDSATAAPTPPTNQK